MLNKKALAATAGGAEQLYVEDVFSTYLYTGNGGTQTITNGLDLSGEGGLVWLKKRGAVSPDTYATDNHYLFDSARGSNALISNDTTGEISWSGLFTGLTSTGFGLNTSAHELNASSSLYASWSFRKAEKFFDVVTYTGNGSARTISHNLGSTPGTIIIKQTSDAQNWIVYHRSLGATKFLILNSTQAGTTSSIVWNDTEPTSSVFSLGTGATVNTNGASYVAYLFAHDAGGFGDSGSDSIIKCGGGTWDSNGWATVSLGWEPQFVLIKGTSTANWILYDSTRGMSIGVNPASPTAAGSYVLPNTSDAETLTTYGTAPLPTGFVDYNGSAGQGFIYIAIRKGNMKTPSSGTEVFTPTAYTATNVDNRLVDTGLLTDMVMVRNRAQTSAGGFYVADRKRANFFLATASSSGDASDADSFMTPTSGKGVSFSAMNGFGVGNDSTRRLNYLDYTEIAYSFKEAKGFFDIVSYKGTGSAPNIVTHNLGVTPELMLVKRRYGTAASWAVYSSVTGKDKWIVLNGDSTITDTDTWNNTLPTATNFTVGVNAEVNSSDSNYIAYLFASCPGVSKIGSYTGNGTTNQINCGFTSGARFVFLKRVDSTGPWRVFSSAQGIVSGADPFMKFNDSDPEDTGLDIIDPYSSGFQLAGSDSNESGSTYLFFAIA